METSTTDYTGTQTGGIGSKVAEMGSRVSERVSDVGNRVSESVSDMGNRMSDREPKSNPRSEHREGPVARAIEQQTARLPSDTFLWAALGSIGISLALEIMGEDKKANFVGHWAPTFLLLGLYNKMVKLQGSDGI